jgi:hypothetical protein
MIDDRERPTEGTILLDDDNPFAEVYILFKGNKSGLYRVRPVITITDDKGMQSTTLTHKDQVLIAVEGSDAK